MRGVLYHENTYGRVPLRLLDRDSALGLALRALDTAAESDTATGGLDPRRKIYPVIKLATNTKLAQRMSDIIDIDTGPIIDGQSSIEAMADTILELIVTVASGDTHTKAETLRQDDFIPWKRGVSL